MHTAEAQPQHHDGLLALMGAASNGCFCRWWHYDGDDYGWQARCNLTPDDNRLELERALSDGSSQALGVVALEDDEVVGWLKLTPAAAIPKLYGRRVYRTLSCFDGDRAGVYVVACLLVHPNARRHGVARALAQGAVDLAQRHGALAIEALPRQSAEPLRDDELWTGPASIFRAVGFEQIDGPDPYPVLRLQLKDRPRGAR